eukprot:11836594-Karenia_brevis.AAC.1
MQEGNLRYQRAVNISAHWKYWNCTTKPVSENGFIKLPLGCSVAVMHVGTHGVEAGWSYVP